MNIELAKEQIRNNPETIRLSARSIRWVDNGTEVRITAPRKKVLPQTFLILKEEAEKALEVFADETK